MGRGDRPAYRCDPEGLEKAINSVAFAPNGQALVAGSHDGRSGAGAWWGGSPAEIPRSRGQQAGHRSAVWGVAYSPDGLHLAAGRIDGNVALWSTAARRPLPELLAGHRVEVLALAVNPRHPLLAYGDEDGAIRVFNRDMGAYVSPSPEPLSGGVLQLAFSPDGRTLAAVGSGTDNSVALWDVERGAPAGELRTQMMPGSAGSPSARTGAPWPPAGAGRWRTKRGPRASSTCGTWPARSASARRWWGTGLGHWPGLQRRLAPAGVRQRRQHGAPLGSRRPGAGQGAGLPATAHGDGVVIRSLAFSPAGRTLASGDRNGTVILWDASGRQPGEVARLTDHGGRS